MNINMLSTLIIRTNLIFRVFKIFFTKNNLLDNIMNPARKEVEGVLRIAMNNKSQSSQRITVIDTHQ